MISTFLMIAVPLPYVISVRARAKHQPSHKLAYQTHLWAVFDDSKCRAARVVRSWCLGWCHTFESDRSSHGFWVQEFSWGGWLALAENLKMLLEWVTHIRWLCQRCHWMRLEKWLLVDPGHLRFH
jgi:hypothetical protein